MAKIPQPPVNGSSLLYWIMGALFAVLLTVTGAMGAWFNARLTDVEQTQRQRGDRVIKLEAEVDVVKTWLARIEAKLDKVLEESRGPGR